MKVARKIRWVLAGSLAVGAGFAACAENGTSDPVDAGTDVVAAIDADEPVDTGSKKDAGKDAAKDAKPPIKDAGYQDTGAEGTPCPPGVNSETRYCGWCGTEERVCLDKAGVPVWGAWGACQGSKQGAPNACDPFVPHADIDCGNCGKMKQTCQDPDPGSPDQCTFLEKFPDDCTEPLQPGTGEVACKPGSVQFKLGASCANVNEGRTQTCSATCAWLPFAGGACTVPTIQPLNIDISATVGGTNTKTFSFDPATTAPRLKTGACPTVVQPDLRPIQYISVRNNTAKVATVSVWSARQYGASSVMAWYPSPAVPANVTQRENCQGNVNSFCSSIVGEATPTYCKTQLRAANDKLTIPAGGGFVTVVNQMSAATCTPGPGFDAGSFGCATYAFDFTVRTDALQ